MYKFCVILIPLIIISAQCTKTTHPDTVALILARGGSKGIPLKNLAKLNGKSLLANTIETIHKSRAFNEIWVSTDHPLIAKEAHQYNASVFARSEKFARDETASIDSVKEFLESHPEISKIALVQCTSSFIKPAYLQEAVEKFKSPSDCVFAVRRSFEFRWKRDESGHIAPLNLNPLKRPRRQDWTGELVENGMFYLASRELIMDNHTFQSDSCDIVEVPSEDSLQIDKPSDLKLAEFILEHYNFKGEQEVGKGGRK